MLPAPSPATHSDTDGQEMASIPEGIGLVVSRQAANPLESSAKESSLTSGTYIAFGSGGMVARRGAWPLPRSYSVSYVTSAWDSYASSAAKRPATLAAITP